MFFFFTHLGDNSDNSERSVFFMFSFFFPSREIAIVGLRPLEVVPCMELKFWHFRPQRLTF